MAFATCAATAFEMRRPLVVDAMVPDPLFTSTHAITIDAAPDQVWPWIAQMRCRDLTRCDFAKTEDVEMSFFRHCNAALEKSFTVVYWDRGGAVVPR